MAFGLVRMFPSATMLPVSTLPNLLAPKALQLAYTIPLLFISLTLLVAGTFLTLDRTRSFSPSRKPFHLTDVLNKTKQRRVRWSDLGGGVGGLTSGYAFGLQLATFLSLLIPSISPCPPLSPTSFFAIWFLLSLMTTVLGGHYSFCALLFSGLVGGASFSLALSVIIHPPLGVRQIIVPLISTLCPSVILLFCTPRFSHWLRLASRTTTASSGAFNLVVSIAILTRVAAWENVWERLWISDGHEWGTSHEAGLSAAYCIFSCIGFSTDWFLNRWLGECPDEKWDHYLASYTSNHSNNATRAGNFRPLPRSSFNLFFRSPLKRDFSTADRFLPHPVGRSDLSLKKTSVLESLEALPYFGSPTNRSFSKKSHVSAISTFDIPKKTKKRKQIPVTASDSSNSDSDTAYLVNPSHDINCLRLQRNSLRNSRSPSLAIETDSEVTLKGNFQEKNPGTMLEYPDEDDLEIPGKNPLFEKAKRELWPREVNRRLGLSGPLAAVPATPSLIRAIDRISKAQSQTIGAMPGHISKSEETVDDEDSGVGDAVIQGPKWDEFWRDVRRKTGS